MRSLTKNGLNLLCLFLLSATQILAAQSVLTEQPPKRNAVAFATGSGYLQFQDFVLPPEKNNLNFTVGAKPVNGIESRSYSGVPLLFSLAWLRLEQSHNLKVSFDYLTASNAITNQGENAQNARYSSLRIGLRGELPLAAHAAITPYVLGELGARRVIFSNVSSSHYLDMVLPKVGLGLNFYSHTSLEASGGYALWARMGYNRGKGFNSKPIQNMTVRTSSVEANLIHRLTDDAAISFGALSETTEVQIDDLSNYKSAGLNYTPGQYLAQTVVLRTTGVLVGLQKTW